jgi:hypothetical protein
VPVSPRSRRLLWSGMRNVKGFNETLNEVGNSKREMKYIPTLI